MNCKRCDGMGTDPVDYEDGKGARYWQCPVCLGSGVQPWLPRWMREDESEDHYDKDEEVGT